MSRITPAERRALEAFLHGGTKAAAHRLGKSPRTVEAQLAKVRERFGVGSTVEAIRIVLIEGRDAA